jgi:tripartite-type tricarboxylate transporter receptor subunit TctC
MKLPRRRFLHLAAGAAALPAVARAARSQAYPTRPVRMIVGFAAGGPADISARLIGQWLSERLGQSFIVENRPGAGGNLATEMVVRARPDGYTLLEATSTNAWNATLYHNLSFDFIRDIAPVAGVCRYAGVMVVNPSVPAESVPEFIADARANPGKINMGSYEREYHSQAASRVHLQMAGRVRVSPRRASRYSSVIGPPTISPTTTQLRPPQRCGGNA